MRMYIRLKTKTPRKWCLTGCHGAIYNKALSDAVLESDFVQPQALVASLGCLPVLLVLAIQSVLFGNLVLTAGFHEREGGKLVGVTGCHGGCLFRIHDKLC